MTDQSVYPPYRTYARIAGILYLVIIIFAGFGEGVVRSSLIVHGDATSTAENIMASELLFRTGYVADLVAFICDVGVSILLYILLKPAGPVLSLLAASFRLLAHPAIAAVNLLNHYAAVLVLNGSDTFSAFSTGQVHSFVMFFLDMHHAGYLLAGAFFGVHCLLLGWLLIRSELFPSVLGILIIVAAVGYLLESIGAFLAPAHASLFATLMVAPAVVAELSLCLWLLIKGVRSVGQPQQA